VAAVNDFKVFRAIGLAFKAWFANFIPITVLAAVLYSPIFIWVASLPKFDQSLEGGGNQAWLDAWMRLFTRGPWVLVGISSLLAPLITYRVIQYMNGTKSSMMTSLKFGLRGVIPAIILAGATNVAQLIPFGGIIGIIITCYWFVAAPAAVTEQLNPIAALGRSSQLTTGRRGGIFGLNFLLGIIVIGVMFVVAMPLIDDPAKNAGEFNRVALTVLGIICVFQLFTGIVQAVSYSLLRTDKDGVTNDELARVFE
jgi:hypothetical protein